MILIYHDNSIATPFLFCSLVHLQLVQVTDYYRFITPKKSHNLVYSHKELEISRKKYHGTTGTTYRER